MSLQHPKGLEIESVRDSSSGIYPLSSDLPFRPFLIYSHGTITYRNEERTRTQERPDELLRESAIRQTTALLLADAGQRDVVSDVSLSSSERVPLSSGSRCWNQPRTTRHSLEKRAHTICPCSTAGTLSSFILEQRLADAARHSSHAAHSSLIALSARSGSA